MPTDLLSVTRERAQDNLFWRYLGVIVDDAGEGWVRLRVPVKDGLRNAAGACEFTPPSATSSPAWPT